MPYSLKEKQREYQREWAAHKKAHRQISTKRESPFSKVILEHVPKPKGGKITWEEVCRIRPVKSNVYTDCVKEVKRLVYLRQRDRFMIAQIAIQACVIKHGGKILPKEERPPALADFARDIGVDYKTLTGWVDVYRAAVLNFSITNTDELDWGTVSHAIRTVRAGRGVEGDIKKTYVALSQDPSYRISVELASRISWIDMRVENTKIQAPYADKVLFHARNIVKNLEK